MNVARVGEVSLKGERLRRTVYMLDINKIEKLVFKGMHMIENLTCYDGVCSFYWLVAATQHERCQH